MKICRLIVWCCIFIISGFRTCTGASFNHGCPTSDTESILPPHHVHTYHFRSEALSQAVGTTQDHGKIAVECDVRLSHVRECYYTMHLRDCLVTASGGEPGSHSAWIDRQTLPDLSKYSIAFSLVNGEIPELKVHENEPLHFLNIKRGVLSAFVFKLSQTEQEIHENHTDIHGTCPMTSVVKDKLVQTSKDMLYCNFPSRKDWQFSPWSLFWNMSFIQHVINSTTDCVYDVDNIQKRIEKVSCKERHAIMLESTHRTTAAVQTNILYNLEYLRSEASAQERSLPELTRTTDIRFEYEDTPVPVSSPPDFLPVAKKMLSDLVQDSADEIRLFTIPQFTDFVAWMRSSHNLKELVDSARDCSFLPKGKECNQRVKDLAYAYLSDALLQCNNLPCMSSLISLVESNELSTTYTDFIFHSWSYMHYSKPGFVTNFRNLCTSKSSHQCWMSLASFIHRIYSKKCHQDEKVLEEVRKVASLFKNGIEESCETSEDVDKSYKDCLIYLKAASNMGKHYTELIPQGLNQFLDIATDEDASIVVRTSALEALKDVWDPKKQDERHQVYDSLLPLLQNVTLPSSVRILSYDLLILASEDHHFEEHLITILKDDEHAEVKYYVAESLNTLMTDADFRSERKKFLTSLNDLLMENTLSLEWILYLTKGKSKASCSSMFLNLPFTPDYMKRFGLKIRDSFIYDSSIYPTLFSQETLFQLFSTFLPATKLGAYFEGWEEVILAHQKNMADMDSKPFSISKLIEALVKTVDEHGLLKEGSLRNFDEKILRNVRKLHQLYWEHHKKLDPYAKAYIDLFGSTVKYYVQDSLKSDENSIGKLLHSISQSLEKGVTFDTTRVIRIIEAYHQVPTMMGLPLNWTTNATLAFSVRAGLKYQANYDKDEINSKGFLQPSAALTFLNRMVLDFPTLTQIGVQANSSGYTSTEFRGQYNSAKGKQTLRFDRPARTQKFLELFRTNQLIKHDRYYDIPEWDIERTFSSWCTKDNSPVGLKFCLEKSYPNVTHRIKPWALMAGWCKWQFLAHPTSSNEVHYDLELQEESKPKLREFNAKFSVSEQDKEKSARFKAVVDESGKDLKLELRTTLVPDFSASLTRSEITRGKKPSGHKIEAALKLSKDFKYDLEYSKESKIQKSSIKSSTPSDPDSQTHVTEVYFNLKTPYSTYVWNRTLLKQGENMKAEAALSYENVNAKDDWAKNILSPEFWENDKKASMQFYMNWKTPVHTSQDTVMRQTEARFQIPRYAMTLNGCGLESSNRLQVILNLAKTDINRGELDTFLNMTYDYWGSENSLEYEKSIRLVNITVPRRSWSTQFQRVKEGTKYQHELTLKRAIMTPKNEPKSNYIGWWNEGVSNLFKTEEKEIKLIADTEISVLESEELTNKYSTVKIEDLQGMGNQLWVTNIALHYPYHDGRESFIFDSYFIISSKSGTLRFQNNFDLMNTYNNLKLTSHSVFRSESEATIFYHNSHLTHTTTETKAYNTIHYVSRTRDNMPRCKDIEFQHDIRSHVFDLSTDASYRCETEVDGLNTLRLTLNTNSSKWNMLDISLEQIIDDVSPSYTREEMTATHATGTIHVDAEWHSQPKHSQKRVIICSKDGNCPNAELSFENWPDRRTVKFSRNDYEISYQRKMSPDHKNLHVTLGYAEKDVESEFLDFTGELIAANYNVWKGTMNSDTFHKVKEIFSSGYKKAESAFVEIASDERHPLNEILKPALKMTLYDYWKSTKAEFQDFLSFSWKEVKEIFYAVDAITQPAYDILVNSISQTNRLCVAAYDSLREKSVTIWAINYFNVPYYLQQSVSSLPQAINELWKQLALGEESVLHFKFVTGKFIALTSFTRWPSLSFDFMELVGGLWSSNDVSSSNKKFEDRKVAMIFGPSHVYTFDGHLYDVPDYPQPDCTYLLAHDVHNSLFTVFSSQKGIHVLFPEMSITVNDENEVFINGSKETTPLPLQSSNGKVVIKRGQVVDIWSPSLSITCRSQDFLCLLILSNYHKGGVIGLVGNADESSTNDFMLPNGNSSNLLGFLRTYEVSGKPECQNLAMKTPRPPSESDARICSEKIQDCYGQFHLREKFLKACYADVQAGSKPCYAASGLSAFCNLKHKETQTQCNAKKQLDVKISRNLEVILIVQESKYLTSTEKANSSPVKGIESLIQAVDGRFKEAGYGNIKFSLVGFGGNGVHYKPNVHSFKKDISLFAEDMIKDVLKTLEFKSREPADAVDALRFSLEELVHDSFDSKVFIVITAKDKQVADKSVLEFIQKELEGNGITLYTYSSYPSIEKGKKVYGVRADGLIFPSQSKDGDAYIDYPKGNLAKLTSSTRGSIFLLKFLRDNKPPAFFAEFAQEVWAKVNKEAQKCRSCKPVRRGWWWFLNECSIVDC